MTALTRSVAAASGMRTFMLWAERSGFKRYRRYSMRSNVLRITGPPIGKANQQDIARLIEDGGERGERPRRKCPSHAIQRPVDDRSRIPGAARRRSPRWWRRRARHRG